MNIFASSVVYFVNFLNGFGKMERLLRNTFWSGMVLAVFCLGGARLDAATFTASLDRDTIALGESATLSLTFEDGSPRNVPMPPNVAGLQSPTSDLRASSASSTAKPNPRSRIISRLHRDRPAISPSQRWPPTLADSG
jgi:hypothetical protein